MIVIDSTVWVDFFNGAKNQETDFLQENLGKIPFLVGDIILCEVLQGFPREKDFQTAKTALEGFPIVSMLSSALAIKAAKNFRALRKKGISVRKTIDCLIATYCIENQVSLLHRDKDFLPFEKHLGLQVVRPWS